MSGHTTHRSNDASLTTSQNRFTVSPSPFNGVKFELGVVIVLGGLLLLVQGRLSDSLLVQNLLLAVYGLLSMIWVIWRTRQVLHRLEKQVNEHGPQS